MKYICLIIEGGGNFGVEDPNGDQQQQNRQLQNIKSISKELYALHLQFLGISKTWGLLLESVDKCIKI